MKSIKNILLKNSYNVGIIPRNNKFKEIHILTETKNTNQQKFHDWSYQIFLFSIFVVIVYGVLDLFSAYILLHSKNITFDPTKTPNFLEQFAQEQIVYMLAFLKFIITAGLTYVSYNINLSTKLSQLKKRIYTHICMFLSWLTFPLTPNTLSFLYYWNCGLEYLGKSAFLGTVRRILSIEERKKICNEIITEFTSNLDKSVIDLNQLQAYCQNQSVSFYKVFDQGSSLAKEKIVEHLKSNLERFKLPETIKEIDPITLTNSDSFFKRASSKIVSAFNYTLNPYTADTIVFGVCVFAIVGVLAYIAKSYIDPNSSVGIANHSQNLSSNSVVVSNSRELSTGLQNLATENLNGNTVSALKKVTEIAGNNSAELTMSINTLLSASDLHRKQISVVTKALLETQEKVSKISSVLPRDRDGSFLALAHHVHQLNETRLVRMSHHISQHTNISQEDARVVLEVVSGMILDVR